MKKKGIVRIILISSVLLLMGVGGYTLFKQELAALRTLKKIKQTDAFSMTYTGDYGLEQLMKKGVNSDQEVVEHVSKHFLHGIPVHFELPDFGCSAFASKTSTGDVFTARNFDFDDTPILVLKTKPKKGYRAISTVDLDYIGFNKENKPHKTNLLDKARLLAAIYAPVDGMNEKGLSVSVLQLLDKTTNQQTGKPGITTTTAVRMLLDKTANVSEAIELLKQYDMHASANGIFHFLISDAKGKSVVVEYVDNKMVIIDTNKATNFFVAPNTDHKKGEGYDRYNIITAALEKYKNQMTHQQAMDVLSDARSLKKTDNMDTQWSVIFDQKKLVAHYSFKTDYSNIFHFDLK